ncbi:MAG TPA: hypothetical protein VMX14_13430 [Anaerolineae bacterium]|nr:hypothetical protein [Anaerolineae bacterium]
MIDRITISTGAAAGANGSATATAYSPHVMGKILKVHVAYKNTPPAATTDLYLYEAEDPNATEYIVNLQNAATDVTLYPRRATVTSLNAPIIYATNNNVHEPFVVCGRLAAKIAGANADDYADVTVWFES